MLEIAASNNNITVLFKNNTYSFHKQSVYKQITQAGRIYGVGSQPKLIGTAPEEKTLRESQLHRKHLPPRFLGFIDTLSL